MDSHKTPKISVIVPCYNMVRFIEQTISSIINQTPRNLELIIVDGGSTDGTLEIIQKYSAHISTLISEPDEGMYYAITKGFNIATGDILCWLNADDVYFPWTLSTVSKIFTENQNIEWLCGVPAFLTEEGLLKKIYNNVSAKPQKAISNGWFKKGGYGFLQQESMFWKRELYIKSSGLNLTYKLAADFELWTKFAKHARLWSVYLPLSAFRMRDSSLSKKNEKQYLNEVENICHNFIDLPFLFRIFGMNQTFNKIIRLLTLKRTNIIHQPLLGKDFIFEERYRSCSSLTLSQLLLEHSVKK